MKTVTSVKALREVLSAVDSTGIGLVPTMGALHAGHRSLVERARRENATVVVSVFVNPTQFNDKNDLRNYPRTPEADCALLEAAGADVVFMPSVEEMYPVPDLRQYDFGRIDKVMEGATRPGHFNGVAQVVSKLFAMVQPARAYFGEKDFQQIAVVKSMVAQSGFPLEIVECGIVRGDDGLALSSRNALLDAAHRAAAPDICRALRLGAERAAGMTPAELADFVTRETERSGLLEVIYFQSVDALTMQQVAAWDESERIQGCIAVQAGAAAIGADVLAFGSEAGDLATLDVRRARLDSAELRARAAALAAADRALGLTRATALAYAERYGEEDLAAPNDILAVEYLRALARIGRKIEPLVIPRVGAYHGGAGGFPSASALRRGFAAHGIAAFAGGMPDGALAAYRAAADAGLCPADAERLAPAVLLRLAALAADRTAPERLAGDRAALERLLAAAPAAHTLAELFGAAASKRTTDASLRRAALYALLGTTADEIAAPVAYTRLLAANARGCAALGGARGGFVLTKPADAAKLRDSGAQFAKTATAERAFALCFAGKYDYLRTSPTIVRD